MYKWLTFLSKTAPKVVILLCLTPDDFTHEGRASGWEKVKHDGPIFPYSLTL